MINWTAVLFAGIIGGIVGWNTPPEYLMISVPLCFIFGLVVGIVWPDEWDIFN